MSDGPLVFGWLAREHQDVAALWILRQRGLPRHRL